MIRRITLVVFALTAIWLSVQSRTNWRFYLGAMYSRDFNAEELGYKGGTFEFSKPGDVPTKGGKSLWAGMDISFSLGEKYFLQTGLNYRQSPYLYGRKVKSNDSYTGETVKFYEILSEGGSCKRDILSIPLRFGYTLRLNEKNQFEFAVGPYFGADFDADYYVGLSPAVTFKHRAFSVSLHWENPLFLDTSHNHFRNQFGLTVGVNFNGRTPNLDNIMTGLQVAGAVLESANQVMGQYYGSGTESEGDASYEEGSSSSSGSSRSDKSGNGFSLSDQQAYNTDKKTYERYDSQLASHFAGNQVMSDSSRRDAQRKMKKLREKWEKKGKSFPHSANESR